MLKWKLNQVFGEDPSAVNEENVITSVQFDPSGEFLAIGYQCGQVVVFRNTAGDTFKFFTQFESHHPEFDFLTSLEIEEKINKIKWASNNYANNSRLLLSTNDKTIKLWKLGEKRPKKGGKPELDESTLIPDAQQKRVFANAHAYNVNSISLCSDGELFISADDLRVNLWNLEVSSECFTCVDIKPTNMNELSEVITSASFHPLLCNQFLYSSSKGVAYMADMRSHALCDKNTKCYKEKPGTNKSFFSEVTSSISDVQYSSDGRYILARDYLHLKVWDVNMESEPVAIYNVHEHIRPKLYELYENDIIFDKFECCFSHDNKSILTGSYSNNFMIFDVATSDVKYLQAVNPRDRRKRKQTTLPVTEDINFDEKVTHMTWSPKTDLVAVAAGNYIYLYHQTTGSSTK
jgi:serine/threonine-protein phosphatase 2A regulatory subunit B